MNKSNNSRLALYPGSFDPFTLGHLDILERARQVFDRIEVAIAVHAEKQGLFSPEERCELIKKCVVDMSNVSVTSFEGLLVDHASASGAAVLIRGLRQVSDFDYEFRMAFANRRLTPDIDTVFFMTSEKHALISASIVREINQWGGDISSFVPVPVARALISKRR